jgi:menaquinone-specific isochorismate synthase
MVFRIDGFVGASPELLIERRGTHVASQPLAGTVGRSGDLATDEALIAGLIASPKDRMEHAYGIEDLRRTLSPVCDSLEVPDKPAVLELRNVSHLATRISGVLSAVTAAAAARGNTAGNSGNSSLALPQSPLCEDDSAHPGFDALSALELVARVHPTPAVGGTPTEAAVAYIGEAEGFDRGRYAGPVDWMDAFGDGSWAIRLRAAEVDGEHASLSAGVGVVAGSRPRAELEETQLKLQTLLAALVRP